eukprot:TRINITY_DN22968_c0_g1_i1.p1 TRINITY_DN22968_c0_g1~~TRINITY_DN22968_c0_g1_i1.p1  ORF type:complete len:541 (+),score=81.47 TRINITY_DN22968_c0_g1_i1:55-1677(+)
MSLTRLHTWVFQDKALGFSLFVAVLGGVGGSVGRYIAEGGYAGLVWEVFLCLLCGAFAWMWLSENVQRRQDAVIQCEIKEDKRNISFIGIGGEHAQPVTDAQESLLHDLSLARQESVGVTASQTTGMKVTPLHVQYKKLHPIGTSSTPGVTLHAVMSSAGEILAMKTLEAKNKKMFDKLQKEIEILQNLSHPHVVTLLDVRTDQSHTCMYEELGDQGTLRDLINNIGSVPVWGLKLFGKQIAEGVAYLHSQDILHRDLKADNILLFARGCIKIADFGEACSVEELAIPQLVDDKPASRNQDKLHGSAFWMAPEVLQDGRYDKSSDVWSLAATLHEMATGKPPYAETQKKVEGSLEVLFALSKKAEMKEVPVTEQTEFGDLLKKMFVFEQDERITADEVAKDGWFVPDDLEGDYLIDDGLSDKPSHVSMSTSASISFTRKSPDDRRRLLMYHSRKISEPSSLRSSLRERNVVQASLLARGANVAHSVASTAGVETSTTFTEDEVVDVSHTTLLIALRLLKRTRGGTGVTLSTVVARGTLHP